MKTFEISLVSSIFLVTALAWPQTSRAQMVFETTFNCPDWNQSMGLSDGAVCGTGDGISGYGGWTTSNGSVDQITAAANNPAGGGGKGFRHWRGDGTNNNGGGIKIGFPTPLTEMWVRFYMRYSSGFQWNYSPPHPHYTKEFYWNVGGSNTMVFGYQGGAWGLYSNNVNYPSSLNWQASQGGFDVGDGQFHCYEYHVKQNGAAGTIEMWMDGVQYLNKAGANLGSTPWSYVGLGSNQNTVVGAGATDYYTDYDDIAVSTSGRIGCSGTPSPVLPPPQNLRVQ